MARLDQGREDAAVVEHVAIHQQHRAARRQRLAHGPEREDAAFLVVGVVDGRNIGPACRRQRTLDGKGLVADADHQFADATRSEVGEVTFQQRATAEAQQHLGLGASQAPADAGGEHDGAHGEASGIVMEQNQAI